MNAWIYAVLAGRVARLRALVPRDDLPLLQKHLDEVGHLARIGGFDKLEEAVRHARDLGSGGRPIAMVIDAVGRAVPAAPALSELEDRVPAQVLLVNLAPMAKLEGATCEQDTEPLVVPGATARRIAIVMSDLIGEALDHGAKTLAISIKKDGDRVVANVHAKDLRSTATFALPEP